MTTCHAIINVRICRFLFLSFALFAHNVSCNTDFLRKSTIHCKIFYRIIKHRSEKPSKICECTFNVIYEFCVVT